MECMFAQIRPWFILSSERIVDPYEYHKNIYNGLCLAGQPSCMTKTLLLDITHKLFNQIFFIPATLIGTMTSTILRHFY